MIKSVEATTVTAMMMRNRRRSMICALIAFHTMLLVLNTFLLLQHPTLQEGSMTCCDGINRDHDVPTSDDDDDVQDDESASLPLVVVAEELSSQRTATKTSSLLAVTATATSTSRPRQEQSLPRKTEVKPTPTPLRKKKQRPLPLPRQPPPPQLRKAHWQNENDVVHVVLTRFMQFQPNLIHLGMARLELFKAFCLPTMIQQTTKQFLWIIRVDPDLHATVKQEFLSVIRSPEVKASRLNIVVVGSRARIDNGHFRTEQAIADINNHTLWWGDDAIVRDYFQNAQRKILLETGLDADDGLAIHFLEDMQLATARLARRIQSRVASWWRIWCIESVDEWQFFGQNDNVITNQTDHSVLPAIASALPGANYGTIQPVEDVRTFCRTPGLTRVSTAHQKRYKDLTVFAKGDSYSQAETREDGTGFFINHFEINRLIRRCQDRFPENVKAKDVVHRCFSFMQTNYTQAIRARSPTSTGMLGVAPPPHHHSTTQSNTRDEINTTSSDEAMPDDSSDPAVNTADPELDEWKRASIRFGLSKQIIGESRSRILANLPLILKDGLTGRCTPGYSCKNEAKDALKSLLEVAAVVTSNSSSSTVAATTSPTGAPSSKRKATKKKPRASI